MDSIELGWATKFKELMKADLSYEQRCSIFYAYCIQEERKLKKDFEQKEKEIKKGVGL